MAQDKKSSSNLNVVIVGEPIISDFQRKRLAEGRLWADGYSQSELDAAQEKYGLAFPPDLIALFLERRPVLGYDWRSDDEKIREMLRWPLEGLLFDVENNALWWEEWGERPNTPSARSEIVEKVVMDAPPLIPLVSHRYIPAEPHKAGNPVFSIYQSDVVYYGSDLANYFEREFVDHDHPLGENIRQIQFWSDLVDRY